MREIGQETVPTSETDKEVFLSLRLAEPSERVKITLDERMLTIEGRRNATIDMRLHAISTMKHHSTNLVPAWLVGLGLALIWIGYRLMVPPTYRLAFMGAGGALVVARLVTKKPTLTVQTSSGDTHVLFGNERALNRLSFMFHHLINNKSMAEVKAKLKAIEEEVGVGWRAEETPLVHPPNPLHVPAPVDQFLASDGDGPLPLPAQEPEPDWMPTHDPEPAATPGLVGFIPSFQPVMAAPSTVYPPDHRPAPLQHPVLVPEPTPPMYQGFGSDDGPTFLPSFYGQSGAHVPGLRSDESETEPSDEDELFLDAELFGDDEEEIEATVEEPEQPRAAPPAPETRLRPRARTSLEHSPFRPRRTEALKPRERRVTGVITRIRDRSSDFFGRAVDRTRASPFATTETSGALREQAAEAAASENGHIMRSLSQEQGGVMTPEEAERLERRGEMIMAAAEELNRSEEGRLETMAFSDLRSSKPAEEHLHVARLDED